MNERTLLLRQVHPQFFRDDRLTSQAFMPFPKDDGRLSVYDGDLTTSEAAYVHYTSKLELESVGVWAVSAAESSELGLTHFSDPLPDSPAHAVISFAQRSERECRKLAKRLRDCAAKRERLHPPISST